MRYALLLGLLFASTLSAIEPFFAPAQSSGSVTVKLHPTEGIATGTPQLVTLGFPFPRGSITQAQLSTLRVLNASAEVPAFVEQLTPWRHTTNGGIDGQSVRVARVQFQFTFSVTYPNSQDVTIQWGVTARTQNVATLTPVRNGWHQVTTTPWQAADQVYEPNVFAVLPKDYLGHGALGARRVKPFYSGVSSTREDPTSIKNGTYTGFNELDHAQHNFFYSWINEDDALVTAPNQCAFRTDSEPWLYDRASTMFALYLRSGNFKHLREAVRNTGFYKGKLYAPGVSPASGLGGFSLVSPSPSSIDTKYVYNECLALQHWVTGDPDMVDPISWVAQCHETNGMNTQWSAGTGFWTERHTSYRMIANLVHYEVTGDANARTRVGTQTGHFIWHQNGAGGAIPSSGRIDGGLYHTGSQHSEGTAGAFLASPWMSALVVDAMVRAYAFTEDANIAAFVRRMGVFIRNACLSDSSHSYGGGARYYASYLVQYNGAVDMRSGGDAEHALDVAAALAWAWYFSELTSSADAAHKTMAQNLYNTYDAAVTYWIRPAGPASGLTAYRISPWRKYGWEYRTSNSFAWLMEQTPGGGSGSGVSITTSSPLPGITENTALNVQFTASGGAAPYTWNATGLPTGWTMSPSGALTAAAGDVVAGTVNFNVTVTDSTSPTPTTDNGAFAITITTAGGGPGPGPGPGTGGSGGGGGGGGGGCTAGTAGLASLLLFAPLVFRRRRHR